MLKRAIQVGAIFGFVLSIVCSVWLIAIPSDSTNLLGFSPTRAASLGLCLGLSIFFLYWAVKLQTLRLPNRHWISRLFGILQQPGPAILALAIDLLVITSGLALLSNASLLSNNVVLLERLRPQLVLACGLGFISLGLLAFLWQKTIRKQALRLSEIRPLTIAVLAFVIAFTFIQFPVTLFQTGLRNRPDPVPFSDPVGYDLAWEMRSSQVYLEQGYLGQDIPFNLFLFAPLLSIDFVQAYKLVTVFSYIAFLFIVFIAPRLLARSREQVAPLIAVFGIVGLFSYGLQFELEQGQYNILAFACSLLAGYLFHQQPRYRWAAYVFFSISFQMKLWPGIFILLLVDNWREWKTIVLRFSALIAANVALFFMLGSKFLYFFTYISDIKYEHFGEWGLSIEGGLYWLGLTFPWIRDNSGWLSLCLFLILLICLAAVIRQLYANNSRTFDPNLLFVCIGAAMLVPTLSNDYKLAILLPATILLLADTPLAKQSMRGTFTAICLFLVALGTSITAFSFVIKPEFLKNNMPILIMQIILVAILASIAPIKRKGKTA